MKSIFRILLLIAVGYVIFGLILFFGQKSMIYFPDNQDFYSCSGFADYQTITYNSTRFYYKDVSEKNVTVFYRGNAGSLCDRAAFRPFVETEGRSMIFVEYAGFSNDSRSPSKELILEDVRNIVSFIRGKQYENVTVIGESLGSGAASYHASIGDVDRLALITPFSSIRDVGEHKFPFFPISLILTQNFDNVKWLKEYSNSVIILHGDEDLIIPYKLAVKLYESLATEHKEFVSLKGYGHNSVWNSPKFRTELAEFLK